MNKPDIPKPPPPRHVHCHKNVGPEKEHSLINVTGLVIMVIGFTIGFSLGILL